MEFLCLSQDYAHKKKIIISACVKKVIGVLAKFNNSALWKADVQITICL